MVVYLRTESLVLFYNTLSGLPLGDSSLPLSENTNVLSKKTGCHIVDLMVVCDIGPY